GPSRQPAGDRARTCGSAGRAAAGVSQSPSPGDLLPQRLSRRPRSSLDDEARVPPEESRADVTQGSALLDQFGAVALTLEHEQAGQESERSERRPRLGNLVGAKQVRHPPALKGQPGREPRDVPDARIAGLLAIGLAVERGPA